MGFRQHGGRPHDAVGGRAPCPGGRVTCGRWTEDFGSDSHITRTPTCDPGAPMGAHRIAHVAAEDGKGSSAGRPAALSVLGGVQDAWSRTSARPPPVLARGTGTQQSEGHVPLPRRSKWGQPQVCREHCQEGAGGPWATETCSGPSWGLQVQCTPNAEPAELGGPTGPWTLWGVGSRRRDKSPL